MEKGGGPRKGNIDIATVKQLVWTHAGVLNEILVEFYDTSIVSFYDKDIVFITLLGRDVFNTGSHKHIYQTSYIHTVYSSWEYKSPVQRLNGT